MSTLHPLGATKRLDKPKKCQNESGNAFDQVALVVTDECSFLGKNLVGRTCHALAQLAGRDADDLPAGGMAMRFAGDFHQKMPISATPLFKELVDMALKKHHPTKICSCQTREVCA